MLTLKHAPKLVLVLAVAAAIALMAACGGGDDDDDDRLVLTPQAGDFELALVSSDIAVGQNRFVLGLIDAEGMPVAGAELQAEFYNVAEGIDSEPAFDVNLSAIAAERSFTHLHEDGERHNHEVGQIGVYVTRAEFDTAGQWQVYVSGTAGDQEVERLPFTFTVRETPLTPAVGAPAPQSVQLIIDDVDDITQIDTSPVPNVKMHNMTIAQAVTSGRPTVIAFATPAFCTSQICGPTKEVVDALFPEYSDRVNFVHVEPYDVERARVGDCQPDLSACAVPFLSDEWGLISEPWVFTIDAQGNIAGKFEGVLGQTELEEHLQELLAAG